MFRFSAILTQVRISEKFIIVRNMAKNPSVIIVGAGVSGIAAATKLLENGFVNLTVLEAENKIGGRVCSVEFGGSFVDLGGQWVHGEKGNLVYQKVKDLDLLSTSHNTFSDNTYYLSNGSIVDKDITDRLFAIGMEIIDDKEGAKNGTGSVGDYFIKVFYEAVSKEFGHNENVLKIAKLLESWLEKFFFCLNSESWFNISTNGAHVFESCEGDQQLNWRDKGYRTILDVLMKKIPDATKQLPLDDKIFLNKEVSKITWDNNTTNFNGVTVNCSDGSTFNADHVIVTTSLGVLKKFHESLFIPELPPYKINSIEGIGLGTVNKILLKFPTKWWSNDLKGINLLWTEEDRVNLHKESHLFGPSENSDNGRCWLEDIFGFYVIDSHPRVLLAFVVGKSAPKVELLSDELVIGGCMYLLKKFSGWKYEIPEADEVLRSKWSSNPHFCGSYAHVSIESENKKASAEDLAKPLISANGKQTVLFAGEATNPSKFSTVHGAIETGYREAERLIKIYK
ncbi:spermine oxidase-like isoform X1 [Anoplophora glabripennis]|uniref:spermine oxidase-like isoform X1 n=1 Tax=Anoplophora glabripennis TaxID=217634 RepID=UPI000873C8B0|nr:spermine oxidase-like isoform X1 [Anoplophora glabripennis]